MKSPMRWHSVLKCRKIIENLTKVGIFYFYRLFAWEWNQSILFKKHEVKYELKNKHELLVREKNTLVSSHFGKF